MPGLPMFWLLTGETVLIAACKVHAINRWIKVADAAS